jgi:hypothetical protein
LLANKKAAVSTLCMSFDEIPLYNAPTPAGEAISQQSDFSHKERPLVPSSFTISARPWKAFL